MNKILLLLLYTPLTVLCYSQEKLSIDSNKHFEIKHIRGVFANYPKDQKQIPSNSLWFYITGNEIHNKNADFVMIGGKDGTLDCMLFNRKDIIDHKKFTLGKDAFSDDSVLHVDSRNFNLIDSDESSLRDIENDTSITTARADNSETLIWERNIRIEVEFEDRKYSDLKQVRTRRER